MSFTIHSDSVVVVVVVVASVFPMVQLLRFLLRLNDVRVWADRQWRHEASRYVPYHHRVPDGLTWNSTYAQLPYSTPHRTPKPLELNSLKSCRGKNDVRRTGHVAAARKRCPIGVDGWTDGAWWPTSREWFDRSSAWIANQHNRPLGRSKHKHTNEPFVIRDGDFQDDYPITQLE